MPAFSNDDTLRLLLGEELDCRSSNVQSVAYVAETQTFVVGFGKPDEAQLSFYQYANVPPEMVESFAAAPSQGVWVHANLVRPKWPFTRGVEGVRKLYRQSAG